MKKLKKVGFFCSIAYYHREYLPNASTSDFRRSPGPPLSANARGIVPAHHHGHQNGQQVWCFFCLFFLECDPVVRRDDMERILARWQRSINNYFNLSVAARFL
jgi:hypothetical protein